MTRLRTNARGRGTMGRGILMCAVIVATTMVFARDSQAVVITFTGGTVTRLDTTTETTNNVDLWEDVDFYEEGGFQVDFNPNAGSTGFATSIGDYYGSANDVIHAHWATGNYGGVESIEITKVGGGTFDLNYFVLTSNTDVGGSLASGNEQAFVEGFNNNVSTGPPVQLPSEDWGFPATPVFLGSAFDAVDKVVFTVSNPVDCFGMDEFFIDEPAPVGALDHFMAYKVRTTKDTAKFYKFGPLTLEDQFGLANYTVVKPMQLGLPADKNGEGVSDAETHLEEYRLKRTDIRFTPVNVRVTNQCSDVDLTVRKPVSLLVPTTKSLTGPVPPPVAPDVDHFLCYQVKAATKLPKGIQVVVADQFQQRRYDLKKITKLCNPVDKSGTPAVLAGPDKGAPKPITPATRQHPADHLVCYKAALARKFIAQNGCGAATPGDRGTAIAKQPKHTRQSMHVHNQFGPEQLDSVKERELCIPSQKSVLSLAEASSPRARRHYSYDAPPLLP